MASYEVVQMPIEAGGQVVPRCGGEDSGLHPDALGAVGESFWQDVVGALFPWEVDPGRAPTTTDDIVGVLFPWEAQQKKAPRTGNIVGIGITFRREQSDALLIHHIVQVLSPSPPAPIPPLFFFRTLGRPQHGNSLS